MKGRCCAIAIVSTDDGEGTPLICGLPEDHYGPFHHDGAEGIWWALDDGPHEGES